MAKYYDDGEKPMRRDNKDFANMPTKVVQKEYPKNAFGLNTYYDDSPTGIDGTIAGSYKKVNRQLNPQGD